jgi:predicted transcriptional regulator
MGQEELQKLLDFFRLLADESRLRIIGILANGERSVEELAAMLSLRAPTISHHLTLLRNAGLVEMRRDGNTHLYHLEGEALRTLSKDLLTKEKAASLVDEADGDAWERKVLRDFFDGERLREIPASLKKRQVILKWLAARFASDRTYTEMEINEILKRYHPDTATLRRDMIGSHFMQREDGTYWRVTRSAD